MERVYESDASLISGIAAALEALQRQDYIETKYILIRIKRDVESLGREGGDDVEQIF